MPKQLFRDEQGDSQKVPRMDCLLVQETMAFGGEQAPAIMLRQRVTIEYVGVEWADMDSEIQLSFFEEGQ